MPIYEYVCKDCGDHTEALQKMSDPPKERCEACGQEHGLVKVMSAHNVGGAPSSAAMPMPSCGTCGKAGPGCS
jgi:putative FmdB family regulatory protein